MRLLNAVQIQINRFQFVVGIGKRFHRHVFAQDAAFGRFARMEQVDKTRLRPFAYGIPVDEISGMGGCSGECEGAPLKVGVWQPMHVTVKYFP